VAQLQADYPLQARTQVSSWFIDIHGHFFLKQNGFEPTRLPTAATEEELHSAAVVAVTASSRWIHTIKPAHTWTLSCTPCS
jgi:hypothetical protein